MLISISVKQTDRQFFDTRALDKALNQSHMSRETLVYMHPNQFLHLAKPGLETEKISALKELVLNGTKFEDIPYLGVLTDDNENVYVDENGDDHEGRHRVMVLRELGVDEIPVKIVSKPYGDGPAYRWGQTKQRPEYIKGYNGFKMPFPETKTYN